MGFLGVLDNKAKLVLGLLLPVLVAAVCLGFFRGIELTNVWNGWSTVGFTWALDDVTFRDVRDFSYFVSPKEHLLNSLANWVYPLSYKYLAFEPSSIQLIFIAVTTAVYSIAIVSISSELVSRTFFLASALLAVSLALCTSSVDGDFARFGQANLALAQAYGVAIPLQLFAIVLTLRKRIFIVGIVLSILVCVHISIGCMTAIVTAGMLLTCGRDWKAKSVIASIILVTTTIFFWSKLVIGFNGNSVAIMNLKEWVEWEKMMNYHFFPLDMKLFTVRHFESLTPMLGLALLAFSNPLLSELSKDIRKMWLSGIVASLVLAIIGVIISVNPPSASFVMLSLHRASGITLLLLLPIAAWHLAIVFRGRDMLRSLMGLACIIPPLLGMSWGIPVIPALLLAITAYYGKDALTSMWQRQLLFPIIVGGICYETLLIVFGHAQLTSVEILGNRYIATALSLLIFKRWFASMTGLFATDDGNANHNRLISGMRSFLPHFVVVVIVCLVVWSAVNNWKKHPTVPSDVARSYLDAQLWAKSSTTTTAVFMPDPAEPPYGRAWSEYSRRASFGSAREWLHVPLVYRADEKGFREGVRRLSMLGIDPYQYKKAAFSSPGKDPMAEYHKMIDDTRKAYYSMTPVQLDSLAKKEGINYFIFSKGYSHSLPKLTKVYENNHFAILAPRHAQSRK